MRTGSPYSSSSARNGAAPNASGPSTPAPTRTASDLSGAGGSGAAGPATVRRMRSLLAVAAILVAAAIVPGTARSKTTACGAVSAAGARYSVRIEAGAPSCTTARSVLRRFIVAGVPPKPWVCFRGHGAQRWAAACARGHAIVRAYVRS